MVEDNEASTNQSFLLRYWTTNSGVALTSGSSLVRLNLPLGFGFDVGVTDRIDSLYILEGDTQSVRVYTGASARPLQNLDATLLIAANDTNTNAPAQIGTALSRISMNIITEAIVSLDLDLTSQTVSPDQVFRLRGQLENIGSPSSQIAPTGFVDVRLDTAGTGFTLEGDVALKSIDVSSGSDTVSWLLRAPLVTDTVSLRAFVDDAVAYDENKYPDSLVARQPGQDSTEVRVVTGGNVSVANIQLISPAGAADDTISTVQQFTLESSVQFIGSVLATDRFVELTLPDGEGYALIDQGNRPVLGDTTLTWRITAPVSVPAPQSSWFNVEVRGIEENTGDPLSDTDFASGDGGTASGGIGSGRDIRASWCPG